MIRIVYRNRSVLEKFFKINVFLVSVWFLYYKINYNERLEILWRIKSLPDLVSPAGLLIFSMLWLLNLGLEVYKWAYLLRPIQKVKWTAALKSVLTGSTVGIFTPNRMGEYLGKVLFLDYKHRIKAVISSLVGSYAQLNATLLMGCVGMVWYLFDHFTGTVLLRNTFLVLILCITALSLLFYFNVGVIIHLVRRKTLVKIARHLVALRSYHTRQLLTVLLLSLTKYLVFSTQFVMLLYLLGADVSWYDCWLATAAMYLVQSIVPTVALSDLAVRGATAVFFFTECLGQSASLVTSASALLWLVNIIIPAALGAFFIFETRLFNGRNDH